MGEPAQNRQSLDLFSTMNRLNTLMDDLHGCYSDKVNNEKVLAAIQEEKQKWLDKGEELPHKERSAYYKDTKETFRQFEQEIKDRLSNTAACMPSVEKINQTSRDAFKSNSAALDGLRESERLFKLGRNGNLKEIDRWLNEIDRFDEGIPRIPYFLRQDDGRDIPNSFDI